MGWGVEVASTMVRRCYSLGTSGTSGTCHPAPRLDVVLPPGPQWVDRRSNAIHESHRCLVRVVRDTVVPLITGDSVILITTPWFVSTIACY